MSWVVERVSVLRRAVLYGVNYISPANMDEIFIHIKRQKYVGLIIKETTQFYRSHSEKK
jgi:hypothetical protein